MTPRILVVDDEASIRSLLTRVLSKEGFNVITATTGQEGLDAAAQHRPELIVLDLNLPDLYGEDVCKKIRQNSSIENVPVLILTGKNSEGLPARCLDGGADDYLSKPFDIKEFLARLRALMRRAQGLVSGQGVISKGRLSIRVAERTVLWRGRRIDTMAPKEFEMLRLLLLEAPKVVDKTTMAIKAWGLPLDQVHQRTLDVHIRRIRKKLGPMAAGCLKTVPSVGFQWLDEVASIEVPPAARR
jgi:DNA-binding response OmpR family regulator